MRNVEFRAKRVDNNEWVYGSLLLSEIDVNEIAVEAEIHERFANDFSIAKHKVNPKTICQLIAIRNGVKFFEHDILEDFLSMRWDDEMCSFEFYWTYSGESCNGDIGWYENEDVLKEVVGNIFDNPELIEG